ncbi:MAG: Sec-independent protein translocase subunit TatA/TatB [Planctomycetota bacterium]|jgi:sec-independent protein translocase protein TatA
MTGISPWPILAFGLPGHGEWIILLVLGLLIFGRRLPDVARSIGRSIVEFKRGIRAVDDDIEQETSKPAERLASSRSGGPGRELPTSPPEGEFAQQAPKVADEKTD